MRKGEQEQEREIRGRMSGVAYDTETSLVTRREEERAVVKGRCS